MRTTEFYAVLKSIINWKYQTELVLVNKDIDDIQAIELAAALSTNPFITKIDLSNNPITEVGAAHLLALKKEIVLTAVSERATTVTKKESPKEESSKLSKVGVMISKKGKKSSFAHPSHASASAISDPSAVVSSARTHPIQLSSILKNLSKDIVNLVKVLHKEGEASQRDTESFLKQVKIKIAEAMPHTKQAIPWTRLSCKNIDKIFCDLALQYKNNQQKMVRLKRFPNLVMSIQVEQEVLRALTTHFFTGLTSELPRCHPRQIANILCTLAVFNHIPNKDSQEIVLAIVAKKIASFNPVSLIRVAWAFSNLKIYDEKLFEKIDQWLALFSPRISWKNKHKAVIALIKAGVTQPLTLLPKFLEHPRLDLKDFQDSNLKTAQTKALKRASEDKETARIIEFLQTQLKLQEIKAAIASLTGTVPEKTSELLVLSPAGTGLITRIEGSKGTSKPKPESEPESEPKPEHFHLSTTHVKIEEGETHRPFS